MLDGGRTMTAEQIKGLLIAYREGWIAYDAKHVAELQEMLRCTGAKK